jgi:hypothetical protein
MQQMEHLQQILWSVNIAVGIILLALLIARENYRAYPAFTGYLLVNLAQAWIFYIAIHRLGFSPRAMWALGSSSQAVVRVARALAVAEICRHMLDRYKGVWALAWRVLCASAVIVLLYSSLAARHGWKYAVPALDRSLELSIATVVVILLLFVRYYGVLAASADRSLAVGFCLYSCVSAVNLTLLIQYLYDYADLWNSFGMLAFLASLLLWTWALRHPQAVIRRRESLLVPGIYESLAPQINLRLRSLNEQLSQFWKPEATRQ